MKPCWRDMLQWLGYALGGYLMALAFVVGCGSLIAAFVLSIVWTVRACL